MTKLTQQGNKRYHSFCFFKPGRHGERMLYSQTLRCNYDPAPALEPLLPSSTAAGRGAVWKESHLNVKVNQPPAAKEAA